MFLRKKAQLNFHKIAKFFSDSCNSQSPNSNILFQSLLPKYLAPDSPTQKKALFKSLISHLPRLLPQKGTISSVFKLIHKDSSDSEPSYLLPSPSSYIPTSSYLFPHSSLLFPPIKKEGYPFLDLKVEEETKGSFYGCMKEEEKEEGRRNEAAGRRREMSDVLESPKHYLNGFSFDEKEEEGMDEENTLESKGVEENVGGWRNNENIDDLFAL